MECGTSVLRKPGPWSRWLCIVRKYCLPAQDSIAHRRYNVRLPSQQIVPAGAHLSIRRHRVDIRARVLRLGKPGGAGVGACGGNHAGEVRFYRPRPGMVGFGSPDLRISSDNVWQKTTFIPNPTWGRMSLIGE